MNLGKKVAEQDCSAVFNWIKDKAYSYLDEPLKAVVRRWENRIKAY